MKVRKSQVNDPEGGCPAAMVPALFLTLVALVRHIREVPALWRETR